MIQTRKYEEFERNRSYLHMTNERTKVVAKDRHAAGNKVLGFADDLKLLETEQRDLKDAGTQVLRFCQDARINMEPSKEKLTAFYMPTNTSSTNTIRKNTDRAREGIQPKPVVENIFTRRSGTELSKKEFDHEQVVYGPGPNQKLDIFAPGFLPKDAPIFVYFHGGYWQALWFV
ncbi:hypothetical protein CAPTEDRAFT_210577 [Capitella teleta]|uniref:Alpha/beta hydrolase fold-3 domain-containing protein n=1 Tax=Capitella teleta TaxID=283909 RepID=R7U3G2_CAPTE|nr:hypothetical protein CAPTEDRAFT_210577 [Capitella teleta]|eukprot:ELU00666.1 hypothetical protein CAPTEDRAFT_210577 [Capitella teleta]